MMKRYRRRPVEVRAVQWTVTHTPSDDAKPIVDYINANGGKAFFLYDFIEQRMAHEPKIVITTLEGDMKASVNDYICQGLANEFWPVKPHVFEQTNEEIVEVKTGPMTITTVESDVKLGSNDRDEWNRQHQNRSGNPILEDPSVKVR